MKKVFVGCSLAILSFGLLFIILFYIYKSFTIDNLRKKSDETDKIWTSFIAKENLKNKRISELLKLFDFNNSDSLKIYLSKNINDTIKCNESFVYDEYLLNKYFLMTFNSYTNDKVILHKNKDMFEKILNDIEEQNLIIANYDSNVRDYNTFISIFPNFIIAKHNGFKRKKYFQIKFGLENKNPKQVRLETIEWIKQIEKEQGL